MQYLLWLNFWLDMTICDNEDVYIHLQNSKNPFIEHYFLTLYNEDCGKSFIKPYFLPTTAFKMVKLRGHIVIKGEKDIGRDT